MLKKLGVSYQSVVALVLSLFFTATGVCLLVLANIGSDAVTMLCSGLNRFFDISLGTASNITNITVLALALIIGRKYIGFTTIAACLLMGFVINILNPVYIILVAPLMQSIMINFIVFICGLLAESLGCAILIHYQTGMNQLDALASGLVDRFHLDYRLFRTLMDVSMFALGFIMGGQVGLGTIICVLMMGSIISWFVKVLDCVHPLEK